MNKFRFPLIEEKPYFMTAMGMQGARFIEGNDGSGDQGKPAEGGSGDGSDGDEGKPSGDEGKPAGSPECSEEELGESGKKALTAERTARKKAESNVAERDQTIATKTTEIEELTNQATADKATIAAKDSEIAVLKLALSSGLSSDDDLALLASVTDEDKRKALAKRLSDKGPTSSPVKESGTNDDGDPNPSGGSVAAGREMFKKSNSKKGGA